MAGTLALCSFGLEMTIGTFLGHPYMVVFWPQLILPNLKQGNQLHLIWAFGPNRPKYCHKGVTQKGPNGHFQPKGTQSKCSSQKNHQYVPLRQKESRITL